MKAIFIINPKSSGGKTGKAIHQLKQLIDKSFASFSIVETTAPNHATELTREAINAGYEHIFAVGGDGTLNEVVNGYLKDDKPVNPNVIMSILPSGTGGDFRKNFGLTSNIEKSLLQIQHGKIYQVDAGKCELRDSYGFKITRYFNNIASLGLSDYVAEKVNKSKWRKKFGGTVAFLVSGVQGILAHKPETIRIISDGLDMGEFQVNLMAVANGKYFAGGMKIAPHALLSDGEFDVILLSGLSTFEMLMNNGKVYYGGHLKHPKVRQFRTKSITIEAAEYMRIELDGETPGILPATLSVLPGVLRFKA